MAWIAFIQAWAGRRARRLCHVASATATALAAAWVGVTAAPAWGQSDYGQFVNIASEAGLTHRQRQQPGPTEELKATGGAAVGDFFGDGYIDIFFTRNDDTDILYRNMGDGTFVDVTEEVFGDQMVNAATNGALFFDANNDGALDLYVTGAGGPRSYFYVNDGNGRLVEQAEAWGVDNPLPEDSDRAWRKGMGATAADYDGDGFLDLFTTEWERSGRAESAPNRLFRNTGEGRMEDVTLSANIGGTTRNSNGFGGRFADMNKNGLLDLMAISDFGHTEYYENQGDGTFAWGHRKYGVGLGANDMGTTVADYNNNGWLDWFVTAIGTVGHGNTFYVNEMHRDIDGVYFTESANDLGINDGGWGWGTSFIDFDNNGVRDLVMVNGFGSEDPMRFWRNNGPEDDFSFTEMGPDVGLTNNGQGRGLIVADFFNNGFLDILIVNHASQPVLYRNPGNDNSWLRIKTVGEESNRMGIGAFITVQPSLDEEFKLVHDVNLGNNYLSHNETIAHFGLGDFEGTIDYLHILWPNGHEQEFYDIEPNQLLTINEWSGIEGLTSVPEPAAAGLLAVGALVMLGRRRRRLGGVAAGKKWLQPDAATGSL